MAASTAGSDLGPAALEPRVLLIGGSPAKRALLRKYLEGLGCGLDYVPTGPSNGATLERYLSLCSPRTARVATFMDQSAELADAMNARLGLPGNDPHTARWRRHKFAMHERLAQAGLSAVRHLETADVDAAVAWALDFPDGVVVKPPESSGCEDVCVCTSEASLRSAFCALGALNIEGSLNATLVVEEWLQGPEFVVNTVSVDGFHVITDLWASAAKDFRTGCVYDTQRLVVADPVLAAYVFDVLTALGMQNGPAHLEVVGGRRPCLIEINPRAAGDLPRAGGLFPDQLYKAAEAIMRPDLFKQSVPYPTALPRGGWSFVCAVFLRAPHDGVVHRQALAQLLRLKTFYGVGRRLYYHSLEEEKPFVVELTTDLRTCPGVVVLRSTDEAAVERDVRAIRAAEASGLYVPFESRGEAVYAG